MAQTEGQMTYGHCNLDNESAKRADSVKSIYIVPVIVLQTTLQTTN